MRGAEGHTKKIIAGILIATFVFQGVFAFSGLAVAADGPVSGQAQSQSQKAADEKAKPSTNGEGSTTFCVLGDLFCYGKDLLLWALDLINRAVILIIAAPAASLFVWVVDPANISGPSGVLNFPAIYTLWQFIRDFFNLFFIFILLFSAFATIFQVDSFNIRNIFKNILLAALLINFSYPITRFLIDAANVPMYYFINDVIGAGGGQGAVIAMNNLLGFSGTAAAAFTKDFIPTFAGIIFSFLFGISLAVLSIMMIVRLIALTLLLIFSPIGFASAMLPGFNKYGQEWWSKFWSYALFGPAAALMLVVSLKFLEATKDANVWASVNAVTTNASVDASGATMLTNTIFYTIPIILIWSTIGLANKFSMAGAATVVGLGYGASSWARKKVQNGVVRTAKFTGRTAAKTAGAATRVVLPVDRMKGTYAGVKEVVKGDGKLFGKVRVIPKFMTGDAVQARKDAREDRQRMTQGFVQGGRKGTDDELRKLESERVRNGMKEAQEKGVTAEKHLKTLGNSDAGTVEKRVAALSLAQQGEIRTAGQLADALEAVRWNVDEFNQVLDKAKPEAIGSMGAAENARIVKILDEKNKDGSPVFGTRQRDLQQSYNARLKKEGKVEYRVEAELDRAKNAGPLSPDQVSKVYAVNLKMGADDLAKQSGIIQAAKANGTDPNARAYFEKMARDQVQEFSKILGSKELKPDDSAVLTEIQHSARNRQVQNTPRSQEWQNAEAAFNLPAGNSGQNNGK